MAKEKGEEYIPPHLSLQRQARQAEKFWTAITIGLLLLIGLVVWLVRSDL